MMVRQAIVDPGDGDTMHLWLPIFDRGVKELPLLSGFTAPIRLALAARNADRWNRVYLEYGAATHFTRTEAEEARRALRIILPLLHESGSNKQMVEEATSHLSGRNVSENRLLFGGRNSWDRLTRTDLGSVYKPRRLALEMFVHEDSERRWLSGELLDLELEWRRANEEAAIADSLLRDPVIESSLAALQQRAATEP
jgi:hypothetical protein